MSKFFVSGTRESPVGALIAMALAGVLVFVLAFSASCERDTSPPPPEPELLFTAPADIAETPDDVLAQMRELAERSATNGERRFRNVIIRRAERWEGSMFEVERNNEVVARGYLDGGDSPTWRVMREHNDNPRINTFDPSVAEISPHDAMREVEENDTEYGLNLEVEEIQLQLPREELDYGDATTDGEGLPVYTVFAENDGGQHALNARYTAQLRADGHRAPVWFDVGDVSSVLFRLEEIARRNLSGSPDAGKEVVASDILATRAVVSDEERAAGYVRADLYAGSSHVYVRYNAGMFPVVVKRKRDIVPGAAVPLRAFDTAAMQEAIPRFPEEATWRVELERGDAKFEVSDADGNRTRVDAPRK